MNADHEVAMRSVAILIETTGLEVGRGHRIAEVAAVEIGNRSLTGRSFQSFVNPGRKCDPESVGIHGLTDVFLADQPLFASIAESLAGFINGACLIVQPRESTVGFLDLEWSFAEMPPTAGIVDRIEDMVDIAQRIDPGQPCTLTALCKRYQIPEPRELSGCLADATMMAQAYLALTRREFQ